eukprot:6410770-Alexandrium_andersonii.AAC.1
MACDYLKMTEARAEAAARKLSDPEAKVEEAKDLLKKAEAAKDEAEWAKAKLRKELEDSERPCPRVEVVPKLGE